MASQDNYVPLPLETIRSAFHELSRRVDRALYTQIGDAARLGSSREECLRLYETVQQHIQTIPADEFAHIGDSIANMLNALEAAEHVSHDIPDGPPIIAAFRVPTGGRGRPRVQIDQDILAQALELRGPTHLAEIFGCSARSVRRRALEAGLVEPGDPVYTEYTTDDGTILRIYGSSTGSVSTLTDEELDTITETILEVFPTFGRRLLDGHLRYLGHHVPRERLRESYTRIHGPPACGFGPRRIERRVYQVAGPNSRWHHDGQHGLIRWKIVFHGFIDGFSRLVLGIQASSNNRAATVLEVFEELVSVHGLPSCVRGDHGTENLGVARFMDEVRGVERGSYIWGRSVHNIRIERLWVDLTAGVGAKWKAFLQDLEVSADLDPNIDAHIWLLHHLFLGAINEDTLEWAEAWNHHKISIDGERQRSPRDMFFFGTMQNGQRGLDVNSEPVEDPQTFGIDWEAIEDTTIHAHHEQTNVSDTLGSNPFYTQPPTSLSHLW